MAALAPVITPALLSSIRRHPHLPKHSWYFITATALSILNRPDEIPNVYKHAIENWQDTNGTALETNSGGDGANGAASGAAPAQDEQLTISRRMREALIKAAAIGGLPKTINALLELKKATPPHLVDEPLGVSATLRPVEVYDTPSSQILHRGQTFFDMVYGKVAKRVMGQMDRSGTEDLGITARLMYGYILSNTNVLTPAETSYVLIAGLIPQDVNPQLKGHLKGALNGGASVEEVRAVRDVVIKICEASGMKMIADSTPGGWGWRNEVANL